MAGPLGTPLGLAQRKRASPRGEAGTSGFLCVSDSDRRVPAAGDLRELLRVPLRNQGYYGFGRGLSGLLWVWFNGRGPHLELMLLVTTLL